MKTSPCTACGKVVDSATEAMGGDDQPKPGDVTICFYCHHLMAFAGDMSLRDLTDAEILEVAGDSSITLAMQKLAEFKKWEKEGKR